MKEVFSAALDPAGRAVPRSRRGAGGAKFQSKAIERRPKRCFRFERFERF